MSDFFEEREDTTEEADLESAKEILEEDFEEGSTIFSAPEEKNDKAEKPKLLKKIIIGAACLLVTVGVIVGISLLVEKKTDEDTNTTLEEWFVLDDLTEQNGETGEKSLNYEDFSKVDLISKTLTLNMFSKSVKEGDKTSLKWLLTDIPEEYTNEGSVSSVAEALLGMKYTRLISETVKEGVDYGFETPLYTANVTPVNGESFTVTVGNQAADKSGYYVTVSKDNKVYLVRATYIESLARENKMDFTKALTVSAFTESEGSAEYYTSGTFASFDYLYFKNNNFSKTLKLVAAEKTSAQSYNAYMITEPESRRADDTGVAPIVQLFSNGINSSKLYCITKTDKDLKTFGLDKPDLYVSIKAGKQTRELSAKLQSDGDYALVSSDLDVILRVPASSLSVVSLRKKDIYSNFLFIETLVDVDEFTVETDSSKNVFAVKIKTNEEGERTIDGISINGADAIAPKEFQNYYQFLLGVKTLSYETSNISGKKPEATITLTKTDKSTPTVLKYYAVEKGRYQVTVNDQQLGIIGSSSFKNILKYAQNVADGKIYNS